MTRLSEKEHLAEQEILNSLRSSSRIIRMKGEEQLYKKYDYFMNLGINKYSLPQDSISDAYSDTILAAIESIINYSFREKSSLKTFLFQIFRNKCIDIFRNKTRRRNSVHRTVAINGGQIHLPDPSQSVLEKLIERAEIDTLKEHLKKLCDKRQRLILLSVEGYTDNEIAREMNFKTPSVVKTCRLRCIHSLRKLKNAC